MIKKIILWLVVAVLGVDARAGSPRYEADNILAWQTEEGGKRTMGPASLSTTPRSALRYEVSIIRLTGGKKGFIF